MPQYKAPLRDMEFLLHDVFKSETYYQSLGYEGVNRDLIDAILTESAKFAENDLATCRQLGDEEGAKLKDGEVILPEPFLAAYKTYRDNGWGAMCWDTQWGGQGLPHSLGIVLHEMCFSANVAWCAISTLTHGAIRAIEAHGSEEMKDFYLPKLVSAEWSGSMCLTEPHAGSDVGLVKTKAEPTADGTYEITGTKIFITQGETPYVDNIVHLVLARLPDAPKGPKGISLFLVPKLIPNADGSLGERNAVTCASLEKKMGIKASPTCVMNFDNAKGWLVGAPHKGLAAMFTMMNSARLDVGVEGLAATELSFQGSLEYARERLQMRAPSGPKLAGKDADPIIVHPDVRRMLMTQKALAEGCRALAYFIALQLDAQAHGNEQQQQDAEALVALLTPINKAFLTDRGLETANLGIQIYGGHGFISEHGMEQIVRDVRIALLYEGTNGIQANDLIGRKLTGSGGKLLRNFLDQIESLCEQTADNEALAEFIEPLAEHAKEWWQLAEVMMAKAKQDPDYIFAGAVDFQDYSGYVTLAYFWALMAKTAQEKLVAGEGDAAFHQAKLKTARFYFQRLLPRTRSLVVTMQSGAGNVMDIDDNEFAF